MSRFPGSGVIVMALATTFCTTAALMQAVSFAAFLTVVGLKSAALGFVDPAEMRHVSETLKDNQQANAFRLLSLARNIAKITAPAAGAAYAAWAGDAQALPVAA